MRRKARPPHWGDIGSDLYESEDGGPRLMRSVIYVRSMHGRAIHKTQKPGGLLEPMITYACPPGGLVIDPFAGSGSSLMTARMIGRRAIGIELREAQAEEAARWLSQMVLESA
jgi:site-specific DNA-methyltransferase (adenine-specific)